MTHFVARLLQRSVDSNEGLRPRPVSIFEPFANDQVNQRLPTSTFVSEFTTLIPEKSEQKGANAYREKNAGDKSSSDKLTPTSHQIKRNTAADSESEKSIHTPAFRSKSKNNKSSNPAQEGSYPTDRKPAISNQSSQSFQGQGVVKSIHSLPINDNIHLKASENSTKTNSQPAQSGLLHSNRKSMMRPLRNRNDQPEKDLINTDSSHSTTYYALPDNEQGNQNGTRKSLITDFPHSKVVRSSQLSSNEKSNKIESDHNTPNLNHVPNSFPQGSRNRLSSLSAKQYQSGPMIRVNIGRVEVRAVMEQPKPSRTKSSFQPALSLDEYLDKSKKDNI